MKMHLILIAMLASFPYALAGRLALHAPAEEKQGKPIKDVALNTTGIRGLRGGIDTDHVKMGDVEPNDINNSHRLLQSMQWQQDALNRHNDLRALHGAPPLLWDDNLRAWAQLAADENQSQGRLAHVYKDGQGQNLAWCSIGFDVAAATQTWYDEVSLYDFANGDFSAETGHFTQLVWKSTTHVGIAVSSNGQFMAANYWPPGNVLGHFQENVAPAS